MMKSLIFAHIQATLVSVYILWRCWIK